MTLVRLTWWNTPSTCEGHLARYFTGNRIHIFEPRKNIKYRKMLDEGVIHPSQNPWTTAVLMVKKKNGTSRYCTDFHGLNNLTVKDAH